jgi:hypothetical protein
MQGKLNQHEVEGHGITSKPSVSILGKMRDILNGNSRNLVASGLSG